MALYTIADGVSPIQASDINQLVNALTGVSSEPIKLAGALTLGTDASNALQLFDTAGVNGRRIQISPITNAGTGTASLQIVPGTSVDPTTITSQLQLINKQGANLERFDMSCVNGIYIIDSTANGAGSIRPIQVQMGNVGFGNQLSIGIWVDGSVELMGWNAVKDGKTWGTSRTTISDRGDTGFSAGILDTRTSTPASNVADASWWEYRRGTSRKWSVGLNVGGGNQDSFDWQSTGLMMTLSAAGALKITGGAGFYGHAVPAQPAAPVTLADVIAIIRGCGLSA